MEGITYRLSFKDHPGWAIGSTTTSIKKRKKGYVETARNGSVKTHLYELIRQVGTDGFDLTEVDKLYFDDVKKLRAAEQALISEHRDDFGDTNCLNRNAAYVTEEEAKAKQKAATRQWDAANPDKRSQHGREYYWRHRDERLEANRVWRVANRDRLNEKARQAQRAKRQPSAQTLAGCL